MSDNLCHSLAQMAKRLCVDVELLMPFLACCLIALNKNSGVRPIGTGDTSRQIIAKAILSIIRPDIQEVAGLHQLCAGQSAGAEPFYALATVPLIKMLLKSVKHTQNPTKICQTYTKSYCFCRIVVKSIYLSNPFTILLFLSFCMLSTFK